jgi:hypothetical protein
MASSCVIIEDPVPLVVLVDCENAVWGVKRTTPNIKEYAANIERDTSPMIFLPILIKYFLYNLYYLLIWQTSLTAQNKMSLEYSKGSFSISLLLYSLW